MGMGTREEDLPDLERNKEETAVCKIEIDKNVSSLFNEGKKNKRA